MSKIRIANAPCSWGSLEFEGLEGEAIGYEQMLDELAETGYEGTELGDWGYMPTDPEKLHTELSSRNLELLGAFVPVALKDAAAREKGQKEVLKVARLLAEVCAKSKNSQLPFLALADDNGTEAVRTKNSGFVSSDMGLTDSEWKIFAEGAEHIARMVKQESGLPTVFHHHCAGYVETPDEIARLLDMTDPGLLGLVFDTGHFMYGCGRNDPDVVQSSLEKFAERIWYVHFKDCHPKVASDCRNQKKDYFQAVRSGVFCELGKGCVDFPAVESWLKEKSYEGWVVVEQDVLPGMGSPKQSAARNRDYLRSIGI